MKKTTLQTAILALLLSAPILAFVAVGAWALWQSGHLVWLGWLVPIFWGSAYFLARRWDTEVVPLPTPQFTDEAHWTPQDEQAFKIVEVFQQNVKSIPPTNFTQPRFYLDTSLELGLELARHYHPGAHDPVGSLRIPEILAAAQLALDDVARAFADYVPGGHLVTVDQWRSLAKVKEWFSTVSNLYWIGSMVLNPLNVVRFAASKVAIDPMTRGVQSDLLARFYVYFIRQVGLYLIEMNSGRLRGGADHYRAAMARLKQRATADGIPNAHAISQDKSSSVDSVATAEVRLALVGQVKAGKSSLINALLGEQRAATDVLPLTDDIETYRLAVADGKEQIVLLDTPGYADSGATASQRRAITNAFAQADLVLLVLDARSPAREPDRQILADVQAHYADNPRLRPPPLLAVLTHMDGLRPVMEWSPPYNWQNPSRPKEKNIRDALDYNRETLGTILDGIVPVCSDGEHGRVYGVQEWLLPAIATLLGEARACCLVRAIHAASDAQGVQKVFAQLYNTGQQLVRVATDLVMPSPKKP